MRREAADRISGVVARLPGTMKTLIKSALRPARRAARRLPVPVKNRIKNWFAPLIGSKPKPRPGQLSGRYTNRIGIQGLVYRLAKADVVCFDIWDVLILRPFRDPRDVFSVMEIELNRPGFRVNRVRAEAEVRESLGASPGTAVTLPEIYGQLRLIDGLDIETGMKAELRTERRYVRPNEYMVEVLHSLVDAGKPVALISDTYLSSAEIRVLLCSAGIDIDAPLFLASECGVTTQEGRLFDVVRDHFATRPVGGLAYAYVSADATGGVKGARQRGWDAYLYQGVHTLTNPAWPRSGQPLRSSATLGLIDLKFGNVTTPSPGRLNYYALGYRYAGPIALAYVDWLTRRARELRLDRLVFLSRGGYLPHAVYQLIDPSIPSCYLPWSRSIGLRSTAREFKSEWVRDSTTQTSSAGFKTEQELLEALGLEFDPRVLSTYGIGDAASAHLRLEAGSDESVGSNAPQVGLDMAAVRKLLTERWDEVLPQIESSTEAVRIAIDRFVTGRRVGIVDVGWGGTSILALRSVLDGREVHGFQFGSFRASRFGPLIEDGLIESFVFGADQNFNVRNAVLQHSSFNKALLGVLMGAPHPKVESLTAAGDDLSIRFGLDLPQEHAASRQIIAGGLDYVTDFRGAFAEGPALRDLSGGTVGAIYQELLRNRHVRTVLRREFRSRFGGIAATTGARS